MQVIALTGGVARVLDLRRFLTHSRSEGTREEEISENYTSRSFQRTSSRPIWRRVRAARYVMEHETGGVPSFLSEREEEKSVSMFVLTLRIVISTTLVILFRPSVTTMCPYVKGRALQWVLFRLFTSFLRGQIHNRVAETNAEVSLSRILSRFSL